LVLSFPTQQHQKHHKTDTMATFEERLDVLPSLLSLVQATDVRHSNIELTLELLKQEHRVRNLKKALSSLGEGVLCNRSTHPEMWQRYDFIKLRSEKLDKMLREENEARQGAKILKNMGNPMNPFFVGELIFPRKPRYETST